MTASQVAELLDVPVSTVLEWGRNGTLPRVKLGRHVRFLRTQVEQVILAASPERTDARCNLVRSVGLPERAGSLCDASRSAEGPRLRAFW